jgi:hypothetical protein
VASYRLVTPFSVGNGATFVMPTDSVPLIYEGASVTLLKATDGFALRFDGLPTEDAARACIPRAFAALAALMLDLRAPVTVAWAVKLIRVSANANDKNPAFDGFADVDEPYIIEEGARLATSKAFPVTVTITTPLERVKKQLERGLSESLAEQHFGNERIRTTIALHSQAFQQSSATAALLIRSMVFEALVPPTAKHKVALNLLARWEEELQEVRSKHADDQDVAEALDSLERELIFRRESSVRSRLQGFVRRVLAHRDDSAEWARKVRDAYDARSKLLHEGWLEDTIVSKASTDLHEAAELVLEALLFRGSPNAA